MKQATVPVRVIVIPAGKLRRYHNEAFLTRVLDVRTHVKNAVDMFKIMGGFFSSWRVIGQFRPDVVFAKGGFVCLPLGYVSYVRRVPLVIHDSDVKPGLTNRLLARYATAIATGSPVENYPYDRRKTTYTGVPIGADYTPVSAHQQAVLKQSLHMDDHKPLVAITGGGLGAMSINRAAVHASQSFIERGVQVYHVCGKNNYDSLRGLVPESPLYQLVPFVYKDMWKVLGAADLVVSRASATFLQELAALEKPVIAIPASQLADQHKNASMYDAAGAVRVLHDKALLQEQRNMLAETVFELLDHPTAAKHLAEKLHAFAKPHAASDVAEMILRTAQSQEKT